MFSDGSLTSCQRLRDRSLTRFLLARSLWPAGSDPCSTSRHGSPHLSRLKAIEVSRIQRRPSFINRASFREVPRSGVRDSLLRQTQIPPTP
jgi:hypothetical protein